MKKNKIEKQIALLLLTNNIKTASLSLLILALGYGAYLYLSNVSLNPMAYYFKIV